MRFSISLLLFAICCSVHAQQIATDVLADGELMQWNTTFIERNSIERITGDISVKREGRPIVDKPQKYLYRFDEQGRITYRNTSFGYPGSGVDTAFTISEYEGELVTRKLTTDLGGHFERTFAYDSLGRITEQTYARVQNLNQNRYSFEPGERTEISDETYTYSKQGKTLKRTYLNDYGLPFKERSMTYNDLGYLITIEDVLLISRKRTIEQFRYDERGRLTTRLKQAHKGGIDMINYTYDSVNNMTKREVFRDNKKLRFDEYLYDLDTGLLDARLTKDMATNIITIVKYEYAYR